MTKRLTTILFSLSFLTLLSVFSIPTHAQGTNVCNPPMSVYGKIQDSYDRNIRETVQNNLTSSTIDWGFTTATGLELAEFMNCGNEAANQLGSVPELSNVLTQANCGTTNQTTCQNAFNMYAFDANGHYDRNRFASGKVSGSLLGMAYSLQNSLMYEPLPVNTAYFFKDYAYKLPIVGERVLAADIDYRNMFIASILGIWKITRNVAYALMALIMLYVGITIIMRKQVNQKVVVTVQYSLPKIIIALILIAFSYPIGSLLTSVSWSLFYSASTIVRSLGQASGAVDPSMAELLSHGISMGVVMLIIITTILTTTGIGIGLIALVVILVLVSVGLFLVAQFKALMLLFRMLIGTVTAPITFALSAIPGNEDKTVEWFKQMVSYGLGIFGIGATIVLIHMFGLTAIRDAAGGEGFAGTLFSVFGFLFIFVFGYTFAITVPEKIERMIMGPKKR